MLVPRGVYFKTKAVVCYSPKGCVLYDKTKAVVCYSPKGCERKDVVMLVP